MVLFFLQPVKGGREGKACGGGPPNPQHRHGAAAPGGAGRQNGPGASRGKARVEVYGAMGKTGRWGRLRDWVSSGSGT